MISSAKNIPQRALFSRFFEIIRPNIQSRITDRKIRQNTKGLPQLKNSREQTIRMRFLYSALLSKSEIMVIIGNIPSINIRSE